MKPIICLFLFSFWFLSLKAQNTGQPYHPYQKFGDTKIKVLTLSNGKYNEFFDTDTIEIIGSAVLNTKTMKVIGFVEKDTTYSEATLDPTVVSRWLSPDPLAAKYPSLSPYNFTANNPILFIDPDGRDIVIRNKTDQANYKAALALVFNNSSEAFNFDKRGKLVIDQSKIHGELVENQTYILGKLSDIANDKNIVVKIKETTRGETGFTKAKRGSDGQLTKVNININLEQANLEEKLRDTDDGSIKEGDPDFMPSETQKRAILGIHDIGHVSEDRAGNKIGGMANDNKTVGFENKVRRIFGLKDRIGNFHGDNDGDGRYENSGSEEPSK